MNVPWKRNRNRKSSWRLENSTEVQISQSRALPASRVERQSWEDLRCLSHLNSDFQVEELLVATDLRPAGLSQVMRTLTRPSNQEYQWEVACRFFSGFSSDAAVGNCEGDHKPHHYLCVEHSPHQARRSRSVEL